MSSFNRPFEIQIAILVKAPEMALSYVDAPIWQGLGERFCKLVGAVICPACWRGTEDRLALMKFADRVPSR
jgi:hypothetical protein